MKKEDKLLPKYRVVSQWNDKDTYEYFANLKLAMVRFDKHKADNIGTCIEKLIIEHDGDVNYESTAYSFEPDVLIWD